MGLKPFAELWIELGGSKDHGINQIHSALNLTEIVLYRSPLHCESLPAYGAKHLLRFCFVSSNKEIHNNEQKNESVIHERRILNLHFTRCCTEHVIEQVIDNFTSFERCKCSLSFWFKRLHCIDTPMFKPTMACFVTMVFVGMVSAFDLALVDPRCCVVAIRVTKWLRLSRAC